MVNLNMPPSSGQSDLFVTDETGRSDQSFLPRTGSLFDYPQIPLPGFLRGMKTNFTKDYA